MNTSALARFSDRPQRALRNAYLKFLLRPETSAVFPIQYVQEAFTLPAYQLTPMPNVHPCMLGLMNRRSHVLWAVDLIQLLGLSISNTSVQQYNLVIVQANSIPLGLAIQRVQGITWLETDAIQAPPGQVSLGIVPYLSGCVLQQQNVLLILDAAAIVQSSSSLIKLHPLNRGNLTNSLPQ